jgi:hypothetical protein
MQALPLILTAGGALLKGVGQFKAGQANRAIAKSNARTSILEGNEQANRIRDLARIQLGRQMGAQAESGFTPGTGSAIDSLVESQTNAELEALDARRAAESRAAAYRAQGKQAYQEGIYGALSSVVGGAADVAGQAHDYAQAKQGY